MNSWSSDGHPSPALLEQEPPDAAVRAHLETCAACRVDRRVLLASSEASGPAPSGTWTGAGHGDQLLSVWLSSRDARAPNTPPPDPPRRVGRYVVDAVLGQGGLAVVYRATADGHPDEPVALKLLVHGDGEQRARLRREGGIQQALRHENVVQVHEVLEHEGQPVLVMDYVAGPSLHALLRARVPPLAVADRLAHELLSGVAAAHRAGVVHRDVKPANVLLDPGAGGSSPPRAFTARVGDFGLARGVGLDDGLKTRTGTVAGTPSYMAPEQLRDASRADARADVFSVGAVLYELVSGLRAFAGLDYVDVVRRVADVRYAPLPAVAPRAPERMVRAIHAALAASPTDRPADAAELLAMWSRDPAPPAPWPASLAAEVSALHAPRELPRSEVSATAPHNLESPSRPFVGRHDDRAAVAALLARHRLVTLTGPGGVGKTRLAVELGYEALSRFPGGIWFCDLSTARGFDGVVRAVAQGLGESPGADPVGRLGAALQARGKILVILDNFEQVVDQAERTVEVWLDRAPEATFLVTSREPLDLLDEVSHTVEPLATPAADSDRTDAVELFAVRAREAFPSFAVSPDNRADVAALVRELDGLPLAIEIAAARVRSNDLGPLLGKLRPRLHELAARDPSVVDRQRTLQATLDWSWDLLSLAERAALSQVSVFVGGFGPEAGAAVVRLPPGSPGPVEVFEELAHRSLIRRRARDGAVRYELFVSVRDYAGRRLDAAGDEGPGSRSAAEARHVTWFAAASYKPREDATEAQQTLALAPDADNYVHACRRALRAGRPAEAATLCRTALPLLFRTTSLQARMALIDEVLATDGVDELDAARLRMGLGRMQEAAGDPNQAVRTHEQALAVLRRFDLPDLLAQELNQLGLALWSTGRNDEAATAFEESVSVAAAHGLSVFEGYSLGALGVLAQNAKDFDLALARFARAREAHRVAGNPRGEALVLGDVGQIHHLRGDLDRAIVDLERSLELLERVDDRQARAVGLSMLADARLALGELDVARDLLTAALEIDAALGAQPHRAAVLHQLGLVALAAGDDEAASQAFEQALVSARQVAANTVEATCLARLAVLRARAGAWGRVEALLADASRVVVDDDAAAIDVDLCRAEVAFRAGSADGATHLASAEQRLAAAGLSPRSSVGGRVAAVRALFGA